MRRHGVQAQTGHIRMCASRTCGSSTVATEATFTTPTAVTSRSKRRFERGLFLLWCGRRLALPGCSDDTDSSSGKHYRCLIWTLAVKPHHDCLFMPAPLHHRAYLAAVVRARVADSHPDSLIELCHIEQ
jgi:hypothetical protein